MNVNKFEALGLSPVLLKVLKEINFSEPSEIQEKVIPLALEGHDVIGGSATGSGKTLAFGAPIIEKIKVGKDLQALILTPTRELAEQVSKSIKLFSKYNPLRIVTVYGGVSLEPQIRGLETANVVVGTPGRILDHLSRKTINLSKVKMLVLDEADRMLDMGFIHDVTDIIYHCPKNRQTLLFSATISGEVMRISKKYMNTPKIVAVENTVDPSKLEQVFYDVPNDQKFSLLVHLLKEEDSKLVMIFCNTKRNADLITTNLRSQGFDALALHGNLNQSKRNKVLEHFHKSEKFILVCTDIASRGLDIKSVSHVYNYEVPKTSTEYIHRIGRTARAGKDGKAITILAARDYDNFRKMTDDESVQIKQIQLPKFEQVRVQMSQRDDSRGYGQRRNNYGRRSEHGRGPQHSHHSPNRNFRNDGKRSEEKNEERSQQSRFDRRGRRSFGSREGKRSWRKNFNSRRRF